MGDGQQPGVETVFGGIAFVAQGGDDLAEHFLKQVFGKVFVAHGIEYVGKQLVLITVQQFVERVVASVLISRHQHVVGEVVPFTHYFVVFWFNE